MKDDLLGTSGRMRPDLVAFRVSQFERACGTVLGGRPFSTGWVDPEGFFVLGFHVEGQRLRPDVARAPAPSVRRALLEYPELYDTQVEVASDAAGVRFFSLRLPIRGSVESRVTLAAEAVEKWLAASCVTRPVVD